MAGVFSTMDKVRPGAYIVFNAVKQTNATSGTRGTAAIPMVLPWGDISAPISISAADFQNGNVEKLIGLKPTDPEILNLREAFKGASEVKVWRMNQGGTKATGKLTGQIPDVPLTDIQVEPTSLNLVQGKTAQINVTYIPENTTDEKAVTFESDGTAYASVNDSGLVTAVAQGSATITVKAVSNPEIEKEISVAVTEAKPITAMSITPDSPSIAAETTQQLSITFTPNDTTDSKNVTWESDHTEYATVDDSGLVTGVAEGSATITAKSVDRPAVKAQTTVTVTAAARMAKASEIAPRAIAEGSIDIEAKYSGSLGNKISVSVIEDSDGLKVITLVKGVEVDRQNCTLVSDFKANDYISITADAATSFTATSGVTLTGGSDGGFEESLAAYQAFGTAMEFEAWNTIAFPTKFEGVASYAYEYIQNLRENAGKKVQAVVYDYPEANYEGIISVDQGYRIGDEEVPVEAFICYYAGITAGASIIESNTYRVIEGATSIINPKTNLQIEQGLKNGLTIISMRQDRAIVVEKDINSLHNYPENRNYSFSKNRVIRTLDDIATQVTIMFENNYIGKVDNTESGRNLFKGAVIGYLNGLQNQGAIQNFDASTDVEVTAGNDIESVIANLAIQPVDSMEKLYMTVMVS